MKRFLSIVLLLAVAILPLQGTACTAIYVGRLASDDGTTMIAKSNDHQSNWANYVKIVGRVEDVPGRDMPEDNTGAVLDPLPETTYRYIGTPWMDSTVKDNGLVHDASVCVNEYGVSMEMSITAFANEAALAADPLVTEGLTENAAVDLVICQSATAREAVQVLCGILDRYGSCECNIAFIADRKETWYIEIYTGHQYAAVRLPEDRVCVFGNEYNLLYLSEYEESIVSPGLVSVPEEHGFAVKNEAGELNLYATYSGDSMRSDYSHMRTWIGHHILAPSRYGGDYNISDDYPLCFRPDRKVSLEDVMGLIRNRYEGTRYSPDETGRTDMRVIGTDTAMSVHIVQIDPQLPADRACVLWECPAPAVYGVFVPVSNASLRVSEPYGSNQPADREGEFDTEHYPWFLFKLINTLCVEPDSVQAYGAPVRAYWHQAEGQMIAGMKKVLALAAEDENGAELITAYCVKVQNQAFTDGKRILNDLFRTKALNSNTLKDDFNPETHKQLKEKKPLTPVRITPDGSGYAYAE